MFQKWTSASHDFVVSRYMDVENIIRGRCFVTFLRHTVNIDTFKDGEKIKVETESLLISLK